MIFVGYQVPQKTIRGRLGYADDLAIVAKGKFAGVLSERTQSALSIIGK